MTDPTSSIATEPRTEESGRGAPAMAYGEPAGPHAQGRLRVLLKYRQTLVVVVLLTLFLGALQVYTTTPLYRAQAQVRLNPLISAEPDTLGSREVKLSVVRQLGLTQDREFLAPATPQGLGRTLLAAAGRAAGALLALTGWRPGASPTSPLQPANAARAVAETDALDALGSGLELNADPVGHLVTITFRSRSPQMAALLANTVAEEIARRASAQARVTPGDRPGAIASVQAAPVPARPYTPSPARTLLVALAAGLALAVVLVYSLDYLDDTIQTPEDITRKLHIPFLGLVPSVRGHRPPVLSEAVPHDFGEAYRALRTSLVFTAGGESGRMVAVTSAQALEGRTTTACNLAMVLAFGGSRVLLVDADMRHPEIHKFLNVSNVVGLSQLLAGQARIREAIQRTNEPNLCVITAGRSAVNPHELLASKRMKQLAATLKQGPFDWIVIDTPPVLAVPDAEILAPLVDSVALVHVADMTRRSLAEVAVRRLLASHPRIIGAVLNRVKVSRNKYYYSRYYGFQDAADSTARA